jgi:hypothetical protein
VKPKSTVDVHDLNGHVAPDLCLATQTRMRPHSLSSIQAVFLGLLNWSQMLRTRAHDHMAGRAGAKATTSVLKGNVVSNGDVQNALAWLGFANLIHGKKRNLRHKDSEKKWGEKSSINDPY